MFKPKTYLDLCMAMKTRAVVQINKHSGLINGIRAEDGSGTCWIVDMQPVDKDFAPFPLFFRE